MSKSQKIDDILSIAKGKPFQVIKARPALTFHLVDFEKQMFKCEETGEEITWIAIQKKYMPTDRFWGYCSISETAEGTVYISKVWLFITVDKDEIVFSPPVRFSESIIIDPEKYLMERG